MRVLLSVVCCWCYGSVPLSYVVVAAENVPVVLDIL